MAHTLRSRWTDFVSAKVWSLPNMPTNLTAIDLGNEVDVQLDWVNNSGPTTVFEFERQTEVSTGVWGPTINFSVPNGAITYMDSPGLGTHRYRVRASVIVPTTPASPAV